MRRKNRLAFVGTLLLVWFMLEPIFIVVVCSFMKGEEIGISFGGVLQGSTGYASVPVLPYYFSAGILWGR